ncbi:MAG: ComF family protein, partial [Desulfovibrionaceae bacterium]|nr:ComF family protein [Desulfovibrionaceae bacterium]
MAPQPEPKRGRAQGIGVWLASGRCRVCGLALGPGSGPLCPACAQDLAPRLGGFCPGCGAMCADATQPPTVCGDCRLNPRPWAGLMFHSAYSGAMRELILAYKFKARLGLGGLLQKFALAALKKGDPGTPEAIVPVPLHRSRLAWRGYN